MSSHISFSPANANNLLSTILYFTYDGTEVRYWTRRWYSTSPRLQKFPRSGNVRIGHPSLDFPPGIYKNRSRNAISNILCIIQVNRGDMGKCSSNMLRLPLYYYVPCNFLLLNIHNNSQNWILMYTCNYIHIYRVRSLYIKYHMPYLAFGLNSNLPVIMAYWACKRSTTSLTASSTPSITSSETWRNEIYRV